MGGGTQLHYRYSDSIVHGTPVLLAHLASCHMRWIQQAILLLYLLRPPNMGDIFTQEPVSYDRVGSFLHSHGRNTLSLSFSQPTDSGETIPSSVSVAHYELLASHLDVANSATPKLSLVHIPTFAL